MTTENHKTTEQLLRLARAYAVDQLPWFAATLLAARLVLTDDLPAMAAVDNGLRVYFNPTLVRELAAVEESRSCVRQLAWVWVHEISHVLRDHGARAAEQNAEPFGWDVAADLEINDAQWAGLEPPRLWPPLDPGQFDLPIGKLAEFYYRQFPAHGGWEFVRSDEGSGVHGLQRPWELNHAASQAPAISPLEQDYLRRGAAAALAAQSSRGCVGADWRRWAKSKLNPRVDWRRRLRRLTRGAIATALGGRIDYSFRRPHRRGAHSPLIRPSLAGQPLPRVTCVVDTSGSMSPRALASCLAEVRGILVALRTPMTIIPCDSVAYDPIQVLTQSDFLRLESQLRGGGGTDMVAGLRAALDLRPPPDVVILFTDGQTPFPLSRYRTPILFGILNQPGQDFVSLPPMPPWKPADVVIIDDD